MTYFKLCYFAKLKGYTIHKKDNGLYNVYSENAFYNQITKVDLIKLLKY